MLLHYIIEFTLSMQVVIVSVYWSMIHGKLTPALKIFSSELMLYIHFVPLLTMSVLVVLSNMRFNIMHIPVTLISGFAFVILNFSASKYNARQYYPFWPFDDLQSWLTAAFLVTAATICYVITALVVGLLPKHSHSKVTKSK